MPSILIIDDEASIRASLQGALSDEGYEVRSVASGKEGLASLKARPVDCVLLDIWMPGWDGLETLRRILNEFPLQMVIMMSGAGTIESAVRATKLGAADFFEKPLSLEKVLDALTRLNESKLRLDQFEDFGSKAWSGSTNPLMQELWLQLQKVAPTAGAVLISGENGTGKELLARSVHLMSPRARCSFVDLNCAALPDELIENELFGHEKGAFTGAVHVKKGKFELAHQGSLFLDEIADMSLRMQAKVLRVLQEQSFERLGGEQSLKVDVRVIAASNRDLRLAIQEGRFREDLFYRLNVIPLKVPALRDRGEDLIHLAQSFLTFFTKQYQKSDLSLDETALDFLRLYSWPGNVRELKNLMERLVILAPQGAGVLFGKDLERLLPEAQGVRVHGNTAVAAVVGGLKEARSGFERQLILEALEAHSWHISKTAQSLGIERTHLHRKMRLYQINGTPQV